MTPGWGDPTPLRLEEFASLPAAMRVAGRESGWAQRHRGRGDLGSFLEAPLLDGEGGLYCVDVAWGRVLHVSAGGEFTEVLQYDGEPNGLAFDSADRLLVADYARGLLLVQDLRTAPELVELRTRYGPERFHGLNDVLRTPDGRLLFTDQGGSGIHRPDGRVYCLHPSGVLQTVLDNGPSPNGIAWDDASNTAYVAMTRDNSVWRLPLGPDGVAHKSSKYVQLSGGIGPDGVCLGPNGSLLVTHLGVGVVWVFDSRGLPKGILETPRGLLPTNVTVDHAGRVFVTEAETQTVLTADLSDVL